VGQLSFAELCDLAEALMAADEPDPAELGAFAVGVRQAADGLGPDELQQLRTRFEQVRAVAQREQEKLRQRMGQAKSGRRALKGYGSLRSQRRCQRASRYT
jgi:hypothetical protein